MEFIATDKAPQAVGPYSQAVKVGNLLFCSGVVALDPSNGQVVGSTTVEQARQCLDNITGLLASQNLSLNNVVKTTCFLKDINDFKDFNAVYAEYFKEHKPARSCVGNLNLPLNLLVEIEVIAEF